jgi:tRNA A37 threonylcarbamoyladenosine dehydratase
MIIYDRQKNIGLKTDMCVVVVGCGGVGYWVSKFLAMSGVREITLFDHDTIEASNLNRLDLPISMIGKNKAHLVKKILENLRTDVNVNAIPFRFNGDVVINKPDVVFDCTDKIESQKQIEKWCKEKNIKYMSPGYDGTHVTLSYRVASWGETDGGYRITPSWVVPAVVIAAMTVGAALKYHNKEISCDLEYMYRMV